MNPQEDEGLHPLTHTDNLMVVVIRNLINSTTSHYTFCMTVYLKIDGAIFFLLLHV